MSTLPVNNRSPGWASIPNDPSRQSHETTDNGDGTYTARVTNRDGAQGASTEGVVTAVTATSAEQAEELAQKVSNYASATGERADQVAQKVSAYLAFSGSLALPDNEPNILRVQVGVGSQDASGGFSASSAALTTNPTSGQTQIIADLSSGTTLANALDAGNKEVGSEELSSLTQTQASTTTSVSQPTAKYPYKLPS